MTWWSTILLLLGAAAFGYILDADSDEYGGRKK